MEQNTEKNNMKLILSVVLLLLVIIGGVYFYKYSKSPRITKENVNVSRADLSKEAGVDVIPAGFPKGIPVDVKSVTESYTAEYPDRGVTLSALTYNTSETPTAVYKKYLKYLTDNDFIITESNDTQAFILSNKLSDTLSIVISKSGELTRVQLAYTARKQQ